MKVSFRFLPTLTAILCFAGCKKDPGYMKDEPGTVQFLQTQNLNKEIKPEAIVFKASGDSLAIGPALNEFRETLGQLNTVPGAEGGRREINWDGVPSAFTNNNLFPGDFFGAFEPGLPNGRKRGLINTTPGTGFSISDSDFFFINPTYTKQFDAFSPKKTFIAVGSTITDNIFKVPGTNIDASIDGFGVVFSGVNNASSTSMEFYSGNRLLGSFKVPNNGNNIPGGFSFLGVYFPNERVTRVRILSGSAPLSTIQNDLTDGGGEDIVVMDDFIYSEPEELE